MPTAEKSKIYEKTYRDKNQLKFKMMKQMSSRKYYQANKPRLNAISIAYYKLKKEELYELRQKLSASQ
jgi:hypothetical protein